MHTAAARDVTKARDLLASGDEAGAIALARQAMTMGSADAHALFAEWQLVGHPLPRDLAGARRCLRTAAQAGHPWATMAEIALTASGSGAPADWAGAVALLERAAARRIADAQAHLALLSAMDLAPDGAPRSVPALETLGTAPLVRRCGGFLSPQECAHIALSARDVMEPSTVADPRTGNRIAHPIRTSSAATIGPTRETLPIQAILRRIAALTGVPANHGEPLSVLHYAPGQQYRMHMDALPGAVNQRTTTVLLFLNEGYAGGETAFEASGLAVAGRGGDAILFANVLSDGAPDPRSRHAGLPVHQGTKWLATRWIRARPFDVWSGD